MFSQLVGCFVLLLLGLVLYIAGFYVVLVECEFGYSGFWAVFANVL